MTITLPTIYVVVLIVILNTIIDHLFNWWFRNWGDGEEVAVPAICYILKTVLLFQMLGMVIK